MTQAERLRDALPTVARWTPRQLLDAALRQSQFLLAAAFILVSGLLTVAALVFLRGEEIASRERRLDTVTRAIEEQTTRTIQTVALGLEMTAGDYQVLAQAGPPHPPAVRSLIQRKSAALPYVRSVWIADAKGDILHDTNGASVGRSVAERAYFRIYLAQPHTTFYIDKPARSSTNGNWRIATSVPLRRADDTFDGVLVAAIEPEFFDKLWNTMSLGEGSSVA